jgi:hypothetical protein
MTRFLSVLTKVPDVEVFGPCLVCSAVGVARLCRCCWAWGWDEVRVLERLGALCRANQVTAPGCSSPEAASL